MAAQKRGRRARSKWGGSFALGQCGGQSCPGDAADQAQYSQNDLQKSSIDFVKKNGKSWSSFLTMLIIASVRKIASLPDAPVRKIRGDFMRLLAGVFTRTHYIDTAITGL